MSVETQSKDGILEICCTHSQTVLQAAMEHGYAPPLHRVGVVPHAHPRDGELLVARVKAGRHSLPLPIFRKEVKDEHTGSSGDDRMPD